MGGTKAFPLYLGDNQEAWKAYDATELIKGYKGKDLHILCDCGTADNFLVGDVNQLQPLAFIDAALKANVHWRAPCASCEISARSVDGLYRFMETSWRVH